MIWLTKSNRRIKKALATQGKVANVVNRSFNGRNSLEVVVSDLTYAGAN